MVILCNSVSIHPRLRFLWIWCPHELIFRLIVTISANSSLGVGCCVLWFRYLVRCEKFIMAFACSLWSIFRDVENILAIC